MLIAHNNFHFDSKFIDVLFKKNNRKVPNNWIFLDSLFHMKKISPGFPSYSLGKLYEILFGTCLPSAHSALGDVKGLERVYINLVEEKVSEKGYQEMIMTNDGYMRVSAFHDDFLTQSIKLLDVHEYVLNRLEKEGINTLDDLKSYYQKNEEIIDNHIKNILKISSKYYRNRLIFWGEYLVFMAKI